MPDEFTPITPDTNTVHGYIILVYDSLHCFSQGNRNSLICQNSFVHRFPIFLFCHADSFQVSKHLPTSSSVFPSSLHRSISLLRPSGRLFAYSRTVGYLLRITSSPTVIRPSASSARNNSSRIAVFLKCAGHFSASAVRMISFPLDSTCRRIAAFTASETVWRS